MGIRSPFDRDSSSSHIVDKMIGNAYPVVRAVYEKLDQIAYLAQNAGPILEAGNAALDVLDLPFPLDLGSISDTVVYKTFDLGSL